MIFNRSLVSKLKSFNQIVTDQVDYPKIEVCLGSLKKSSLEFNGNLIKFTTAACNRVGR